MCEGLILIKRLSPSDQRACIYPTYRIAQGQAITPKHQYSNADAMQYFLCLLLWRSCLIVQTGEHFRPLMFSIHIGAEISSMCFESLWNMMRIILQGAQLRLLYISNQVKANAVATHAFLSLNTKHWSCGIKRQEIIRAHLKTHTHKRITFKHGFYSRECKVRQIQLSANCR